jgi:hypothetical protein
MTRAYTGVVLCDLDHSIFLTDDFFADAVAAAVAEFGIDAERLNRERDDRQDGAPGRLAGGEGYDLFDHLKRSFGIDPDTAERQLEQRMLGLRDDWLQPGAVAMVRSLQVRGWLFVFRTTGRGRFQRFKQRIGMRPLADVPFEVVEANKGKDLAETWNTHGNFWHASMLHAVAVVIDDCAETFDHLGNRLGLVAIQITGRPKYEAGDQAWVHRTSDLSQVPNIIERFGA